MALVHCSFQRCVNLAAPRTDKCQLHRFRSVCSVPDCVNQVYARHLCVRHGGKKTCQHPACSANARSGPFCTKHGRAPESALCTISGCTKAAHLRRRCIQHGGGKPCLVPSCNANARARGVCWRHRFKPQTELFGPLMDPVELSELERGELVSLLEDWLALEAAFDDTATTDEARSVSSSLNNSIVSS
ncbi:hypothetical protein SDRG_06122 [Saprolegnia diclina VS20]|uniref:Uncharacterized protein n=1 Tax=Saprolegnia diclina (strain VS20) TaxID=1156394 RepID=T0S1U4_SAPDV|nr:hypothetical protein SDRG_06122 [Saprolegnia diclina VS20]EQC36687.1 hypothetical protein SDRG_06122 [Saprolegnia diclina VS20]|eukprot:XP_008610108.1 hypothetical protein SDRG_06122 [Saprolegnia diclina VS20]